MKVIKKIGKIILLSIIIIIFVNEIFKDAVYADDGNSHVYFTYGLSSSNASGTEAGDIYVIEFRAKKSAINTYYMLNDMLLDLSEFKKNNTTEARYYGYSGLQDTKNGPLSVLSFWGLPYTNNSTGEEETITASCIYPRPEYGDADGAVRFKSIRIFSMGRK
ncbi:MAG: hypothetical protein IKF38_06020 [Clostridia bacterium]|nr:hypothetical protein [Clostridia bacterium]